MISITREKEREREEEVVKFPRTPREREFLKLRGCGRRDVGEGRSLRGRGKG